MLDKLLKMDSALLTIKAQIAKYKKAFAADGTIDASEQAILDEMEANVKLIESKLGKVIEKAKAAANKKSATTEKTEELAVGEVVVTEKAAGGMEEVDTEKEGAGIALDKEESPEKIRYNFKKLLEEYKKACEDGSLTEEKAKELIEKMQDAIKDDEKELSETEKVNSESPSAELNEKIKQLKTQIEAEKQEILALDNSCISSEDAIRFVLEDIGEPQMFEPGKWRVKRVIRYNPKAKELKYQQKNIHAHTDTPSKGIGKVKDGIYNDVTGAANWQTRKKAKEMAEKAVEEDFIWVEWVEKTHPAEPLKSGDKITMQGPELQAGKEGVPPALLFSIHTREGGHVGMGMKEIFNKLLNSPSIKKVTLTYKFPNPDNIWSKKDVGVFLSNYKQELSALLKKAGSKVIVEVGYYDIVGLLPNYCPDCGFFIIVE